MKKIILTIAIATSLALGITGVASASTAQSKNCGPHSGARVVLVFDKTSCGLGDAVAYRLTHASLAHGPRVRVKSPVTGKWYTLNVVRTSCRWYSLYNDRYNIGMQIQMRICGG